MSGGTVVISRQEHKDGQRRDIDWRERERERVAESTDSNRTESSTKTAKKKNASVATLGLTSALSSSNNLISHKNKK